jgi:hypothetical protein
MAIGNLSGGWRETGLAKTKRRDNRVSPVAEEAPSAAKQPIVMRPDPGPVLRAIRKVTHYPADRQVQPLVSQQLKNSYARRRPQPRHYQLPA